MSDALEPPSCAHIHILGICGTFMAGIALLARSEGYRVTGSDEAAWPPMSTQLREAGIEVMSGYDPAHLAPVPDCVVIGNVLSRGNAEVEAVLNQGLDYVSGPEWLARHVLHGRWVLAVAGTHGKTTTTSMLAWILEYAGLGPGFLIGGVARDFGISARIGTSPFFVVEADEYDTAFFDKRSKFVHYRPRTLVLNNLEFDHADIFPDLAAIERQFHHLVRTVPGNGRIVVNARDANLARVLEQGCWTPQERFLDPGGWRAVREGQAATVYLGDDRQGELRWELPGDYNLANALAAIAAARHAGVPPHVALEALAAFQGVKRRLELCGSVNDIRLYDDFAHHPTAVAATLAGLKAAEPGRVLVVLEPRSNTMRMGVHRESLAGALSGADLAFVYRPENLEWDLDAALSPLGARAEVFSDLDTLVTATVSAARPGDRIVVMSNGGFGGVHGKLLKRLGN